VGNYIFMQPDSAETTNHDEVSESDDSREQIKNNKPTKQMKIKKKSKDPLAAAAKRA